MTGCEFIPPSNDAQGGGGAESLAQLNRLNQPCAGWGGAKSLAQLKRLNQLARLSHSRLPVDGHTTWGFHGKPLFIGIMIHRKVIIPEVGTAGFRPTQGLAISGAPRIEKRNAPTRDPNLSRDLRKSRQNGSRFWKELPGVSTTL